jgi:hypothetical protein
VERRSEGSRTAGWISPVVLYGGRVVGVWEVKDGKVAMNSFQNIPAKPLRTEITRVGALLP